MKIGAKRGLLVSDFNTGNLVGYLNNGSAQPAVECAASPFGQTQQLLLDETHPDWSAYPDFALVWTRPEGVIAGFAKVRAFEPVPLASILEQVDEFAAAVVEASKRVKSLFIPLWTVPAGHPGHGLCDLVAQSGVARILMQMNLRLLEALDSAPSIHPLNPAKWFEAAGEKAFSPRMWYTGKIPFSTEVFKACANDIKAALRGLGGRARKLIVLDLDDTLWGGIVGDGGWQNLVLGGHDPVGEALVDFQFELKTLSKRGIILGVVSKNEEAVALDAIDHHPEMQLRRDSFAGWRINWQDKAQNIVDLVAELNLGLDSVVFIDDNPVERDRIRTTLPAVLVPDWPTDKRLYVQELLRLDCFDKPTDTEEDRQRPAMYAVERQRSELKSKAGSLDEWLRTLDIVVQFSPLGSVDVARTTQLLNKTNQLNFRTRRLTDEDLLAWSSEEGRCLWTVRVSDKFGDSGLTGVVSVEKHGATAHIVDFVLSCRVMGRKIEEAMLNRAVTWARAQGLSSVHAEYIPTPRNKPSLDILQASRWTAVGENRFSWPTSKRYEHNTHLRILA